MEKELTEDAIFDLILGVWRNLGRQRFQFYINYRIVNTEREMKGGDEAVAAPAGPPQPLDWKFSQVFGERIAGEEIQEGNFHSFLDPICNLLVQLELGLALVFWIDLRSWLIE